MGKYGLVQIADYKPLIGKDAVERIMEKARHLRDLRVVNINSTYYGGGVSQLLSSMTILMNSLGIETGWRTIHGSPDFFTVTKKMHNALQSGDIRWTARKRAIYERCVYENAVLNHLTHDFVIVHDPQPLPMINYYRKNGPWIWRCHIDLGSPNSDLWSYLRKYIEKYDVVVLSAEEYKQELHTPQVLFMPAIDPFSAVNTDMSESETRKIIRRHDIPMDLPLVVQISRFDRWKDPQGVIDAFNLARKEVPCRLVLLGNVATDDPEGPDVYESLLSQQTDDIIIMSLQDGALVNALQRQAAVVLQKSLREGFGLTVSEAMWKGTPVIGGDVGGIKLQIEDGVNGYLVSSVDEAAARIVDVVRNPEKSVEMGRNARETVRQKFLLSRLLEQYLDLFNGFETVYRLKHKS